MMDVNDVPIVACTTTLLDSSLSPVASILATTLMVDFSWPYKTSIYKIRIACKGSPSGRLYITVGPSSANKQMVQNFDLSYMGTNGYREFEPRIMQVADPADASDGAMVRLYIRDHNLASAVPYQISFETEEYR